MSATFQQDSNGGAVISYQHCSACDTDWYFTRSFCSRCGSHAIEMKSCLAAGRLQAKSTLSRAPSKALQSLAPYTIALIDIEGGRFQVMVHCAPDLVLGATGVCRWSRFGDSTVLLFQDADRL